MKEILKNIGLVVGGVAIIATGVLTAGLLQSPVVDTGLTFGYSYGPVIIDSLTSFTTSTGSYGDGTIPVKLLDRDDSRTYAIITNNSGATVWLYVSTREYSLDGTGDADFPAGAATSSITELNGIELLTANSYEITAKNLITGFIYASSSEAATKKAINVSYK